MERIVVTGAKGGTGPTIVRVLREAGYRVLGVDLKPCGVWEKDYRQVNLDEGAGVHDVLAGADAVVHFGSLPTDSWTSWETAYRNLSLGGYHVLQAAANLRIPRVLLASSPMVYGDFRRAPYLPIDELVRPQPDGIYGAVKEHLDNLAGHYARWHGLRIASFRPQRIVYERSYEWRFRRFTEDERAAADQLWSYIDARDVASACLAWLRSDLGGFEIFNLAADDVCVDVPTRDLLERHYPHVTDVRGRLEGYAGLIDISKARRLLGWSPAHRWRDMEAESRREGYTAAEPG
jgi:nucleoside-diphosphate-sugar epimerase